MQRLIPAIIIVVMGVAIIVGYLALRWQMPGNAPVGTPMNNAAALATPSIADAVVAETVTYGAGYRGYSARPKADGRYPGVVMIHEWWGLNDNIKQMARSLAGEGYAVLAVDLYGGQVAETTDLARILVSGLNQEQALAQMQAAVAELQAHGAPRVASLGWCFGGGQSLQLALRSTLDATVIYYGQLVTSTDLLSNIRWPVLGVFGSEDRSIPVASVQAFDAALDGLGIANEIHVYPGVGHAFANPSGANFAPEETQDAWGKTLEFLKRNLTAA